MLFCIFPVFYHEHVRFYVRIECLCISSPSQILIAFTLVNKNKSMCNPNNNDFKKFWKELVHNE